MAKFRVEEIGDSIRFFRKLAKLTQVELAKMSGISQNAISCWENGVHIPNVWDLWKIADILEISIDELIGRDP